ncbi:MAG: rhomboid family intramembrane serine protease [Euryarchaeota archaeon]|nr:rhomboid family intramembrane serine protease [Euryarchaeota archaeon]
MKKILAGALLPTMLILFILISGFSNVSASHEDGHYAFEIEEGYFYPMLLSQPNDEGVEILVTSNKNIDVLLLTPEMYESCCSGTEMQEYEYLKDGSSVLNTDEYSYVIENGVGPRYIIFDYTSEPSGGANPSGIVSVEVTLLELPENVFEFHWQNLVMSLIFFPLSLLLVIESIKPGIVSGLMRHDATMMLKNQLLNNRMPMTYALIFANTLFFVLRAIFSPEEDNLLEYVEWGAMASGSVFDGNIFSILTANFFHFDLMHLGGNMFAIYILGRYIEPKFGPMRYLGILIAGGFVASLLSLFYDPFVASGGASGMVFCAFGVVLMEWFLDIINSTKYKYCQWHDMQWFWGTLILNVFISFVPGVSLLGHLGGLIGGIGIILAMVTLGTHPVPRKDQLINCQNCDFSFPVVEIAETELNNCPKCGQMLIAGNIETRFPGWPIEIIQAFFEKGWTENQLAEYYQEQLEGHKLDSISPQDKAIDDSEE